MIQIPLIILRWPGGALHGAGGSEGSGGGVATTKKEVR